MCGFKRLLIASLALCLVLGGCSRERPWHSEDISKLVPDLAFTLTDDQGKPVTAADYRGKIVLLYFGYTHCPDVCPTTLAELASALQASRDRGAGERVLFVTVDPARDSAAVMHAYTGAFGPQFVGLRGNAAQLDALTRRYRVTYSLGRPDAQGNYDVTHSSAVFVFDRSGHARLLITPKNTAADVTADLDRLNAE